MGLAAHNPLAWIRDALDGSAVIEDADVPVTRRELAVALQAIDARLRETRPALADTAARPTGPYDGPRSYPRGLDADDARPVQAAGTEAVRS